MDRFRVQCSRLGFENAPGLVGDYDTQEAAQTAAQAVKQSSPDGTVTITPGTDTPPDQQPEDKRNEYGQHFVPTGDAQEVS